MEIETEIQATVLLFELQSVRIHRIELICEEGTTLINLEYDNTSVIPDAVHRSFLFHFLKLHKGKLRIQMQNVGTPEELPLRKLG